MNTPYGILGVGWWPTWHQVVCWKLRIWNSTYTWKKARSENEINSFILTKPMQPKDYRPISVTPVLSWTLERHVVRSYIYPALQQPPLGLNFTDQFAFRPTGSTVAAVIALIHTVLKKLSTNHYVHVFTLDFSKAFDTVRHAAVMESWRNSRYLTQFKTGLLISSKDTHIAQSLQGNCQN